MAWEARGNSTYYYRKRRIGTRVMSTYVGSSETAGLIARLDALDREQRAAERMMDVVDREARELTDRDGCVASGPAGDVDARGAYYERVSSAQTTMEAPPWGS